MCWWIIMRWHDCSGWKRDVSLQIRLMIANIMLVYFKIIIMIMMIIQHTKLCICSHFSSWAFMNNTARVCSTSAPLSYFYTLHVMKSCMQQNCRLMSEFSMFKKTAVSFLRAFLDKNKAEPCCHISAPFFFGGAWMDEGMGVYPPHDGA